MEQEPVTIKMSKEVSKKTGMRCETDVVVPALTHLTSTERIYPTGHTFRRRARPGFILVEMIVATVLLAVGVVATLGAIHAAAQTTLAADGAQTAALLAQKQITELELQPDQITGGDQQGEFGDEYPGYKFQQSVEATDYTNLFKVTVTIQWGQGNDIHKRDFVTYLSNGQLLTNSNGVTPGSTTTTGTTTNSSGGL